MMQHIEAMFEHLSAVVGLGEIFALSSAMVWAMAVVMFRHGGQHLTAFQLNLFKNFVGLCLLIPTSLIMAGAHLPDYSGMEWVLVLLSGYVGIAIADTWYLRALQLLGAARTGVVASLYSPMMVLLSMLFLGERLSAWQYPGFVLVLAGILLVTWKHRKEDISKADLITGVAFGAGGVLLMATGIIMVKAILEQHEFFWTTTLRLMAGTAGMLIAMTWRKEWTHTLSIFKPSHFFNQQPWIYLISGSVLGTYLSMVFWLAGYRYTQASIASILNETAAVFIVIMAWLFLKEPLNLRKVLGIVLALSGVLVLLLGG